MVNNLEKFREMMNFDDENDFYFIQILKRKKDNPDMDRQTVNIKDYYIKSLEYFDKKVPSMIENAEKHNARVMVRVNKRNYKKLSTKYLIEIANEIDNGNFSKISNLYSSVAGKFSSDNVKKWILDVDEEDMGRLGSIKDSLNTYQPLGDKLISEYPSSTGTHLIVKAFDPREFSKDFPSVEIKKDSPTNLYFNPPITSEESLDEQYNILVKELWWCW